ncbi:MAG: GNAT family protein [Phycisphaerales bacterium]
MAVGLLISEGPIGLRHPREADRAEWVALKRASAEHLAAWSPIQDEGDDLDAQFDRVIDGPDTDTTQRHLIVRDGAIVGMVGLTQIFRRSFCNAILGYWMGAAHANRGIGTVGVRLAVRRAFEQLGLHRVEANVMPGNVPSIRLVRSLGFRFEGYSPRYLQIAGVWEDHTRWAITEEDWDAG